MTLSIILSNKNQHSLELYLILNQVLNIYGLPHSSTCQKGWGGSIGGDGSESVSSMLVSALTDLRVLQIWFDFITSVLYKPLLEADMGFYPRGDTKTVDEKNACPWWKVNKWSAQIMRRLLSRYGIPGYSEDEEK